MPAAVACVNVPAPESKVHTPVPVVGMFALSVADDAQIVRSVPELATDGGKKRVMITSSNVTQVPLVTVHRNTLAPVPSALTVVVGEEVV